MKPTLVLGAALAAAFALSGAAMAQTAFSDYSTGTPGSAIGSGLIGPSTAPAPPPPLRAGTPGEGAGPLDTFGYGAAGGYYSGANAPGTYYYGTTPNPYPPPALSPIR